MFRNLWSIVSLFIQTVLNPVNCSAALLSIPSGVLIDPCCLIAHGLPFSVGELSWGNDKWAGLLSLLLCRFLAHVKPSWSLWHSNNLPIFSQDTFSMGDFQSIMQTYCILLEEAVAMIRLGNIADKILVSLLLVSRH